MMTWWQQCCWLGVIQRTFHCHGMERRAAREQSFYSRLCSDWGWDIRMRLEEGRSADWPSGIFSSLFSDFLYPLRNKTHALSSVPTLSKALNLKAHFLVDSLSLLFSLFFFYIWLPGLIEWMVRWALLWFNVLPAVWAVAISLHL